MTVVAVLLSLVFSANVFAKKEKKYVFSVQRLKEIARSVKGMPRKEMLKRVEELIKEEYSIAVRDEGIWTFNSVGGSLAEIKILFCSMNEYVSIWGAPMPTNGFSGRYKKMDVWDIMLDGKMESYAPGEHEVTKYENGVKDSFLPRGKGVHYRLLEGGAYMIDYGRGNLISSLNDGVIKGHGNVTGDGKSRKEMLGECWRSMKKNFKNRKVIRQMRIHTN